MSRQSNAQPGCLFAIFRLLGLAPGSSAGEEALPYRLRDDFLSPAELSFYRSLQQAVGERWVICPKVRVADILFVKDRRANMAHANRLSQKHADFVLCDPATMKPVAVVELDDESHARLDREARDEFLDRAYAAAGLPALHMAAKRGYTQADLAALLSPLTDPTPVPAGAATPPAAIPSTPAGNAPVAQRSAAGDPASPPRCPKCGIAMVQRSSKRPDARAQSFWGCANYPRCRETAPLPA